MQQSPFENIFNILGGLSQGNEKPMKHAFYNAFALLILVICCTAFYVLYLILEPFFKPLFWALLVGSLLHPFKHKLSKKLKAWLNNLDKSDSTILFGLISIPVNTINYASETIGQQFVEHYKAILGLLSAIFILPWLYTSVPRSFACLFWQFTNFICFCTSTLINMCNLYITVTFSVAYFISVYTLWTPERASVFKKTSILLWLIVTGYMAGLAGAFEVYIFVLLQVVGLAGFIIEILEAHKKLCAKDPEASLFTAFNLVMTNENFDDDLKKEVISKDTLKRSESEPKVNNQGCETPNKEIKQTFEKSPDSLTKRGSWTETESITSSPRHAKMLYKTRTLSALPLSTTKKSPFESQILASLRKHSLSENYMKNDLDNDEEETALYFKLLFSGCTCVLIWKHIWLLPMMLFFLAIHVIKRMLVFFGVSLFFKKQYKNLMDKFDYWWKDRQTAIVPAHVRGIFKILSVLNSNIRSAAYDSVDSVSSCIVITGLILFVICASIFICIQIYSEAIVVLQLSGSVLNSTIVQNSELHAYLPEGWEEKFDSLIDNAYTYGREGISKAIKSILVEGDPEKITRVEQQVLELWDRIYQSWVSGHFQSNGPQVDSGAVQDSWDSFITNVTKTPGIFDYSGIITWVQANVGTLTAIASNIWAPLASNMSLLAGSVGTFASVVLCSGGAILNFILSLVIFFTTLFYLLASSNNLYKPVELITQIQPNFGPRLGIALTVAINQVFRASFKMALFYGLWTWLVHNLYGAKVVYLPSALAAVLGAAPFLGPWLAGVPAALDVWLQGRPVAALLLVLTQAAPMAFLDAAVYKEIKNGGHPYVTGLAIAGGMFYLGAEGAILGPLLLCCLLAVLNLSSSILSDTPSEERAALHSRVRLGAYM